MNAAERKRVRDMIEALSLDLATGELTRLRQRLAQSAIAIDEFKLADEVLSREIPEEVCRA